MGVERKVYALPDAKIAKKNDTDKPTSECHEKKIPVGVKTEAGIWRQY